MIQSFSLYVHNSTLHVSQIYFNIPQSKTPTSLQKQMQNKQTIVFWPYHCVVLSRTCFVFYFSSQWQLC